MWSWSPKILKIIIFPLLLKKNNFFLSNAKEPSCEEARLYNFFPTRRTPHSVEITKNFIHIIFWQKIFVKATLLLMKILKTKQLISLNIFSVRVNFSFFHTVWECVSFSWPTLSFIDVHFIKKNFFWKLFFIHEKESA